MVACQKYDLAAALGFRVVFIPLPPEFGPGGDVDVTAEPYFDLMAESVEELVEMLSA